MGDIAIGTLCIGGRIERSKIPALVAALQLDMGPDFTFDKLHASIGSIMAPFIVLEEVEVNNGEFLSLPGLIELGLTVAACHGSGDNYIGSTAYYSPALGHIVKQREVFAESFLTVSDLQGALEQGKTLADVLAMHEPPFTVPPTFEIIDDASVPHSAEAAVAAAIALVGRRA